MALLIPGQIFLSVLAAIAMGSTPARRVVAFALGSIAPSLAFIAPAERSFLRLTLTAIGLLCLLRLIDLARDNRTWPAFERVWFVLSPFDTRRTRTITPRLEGGTLLFVALWATVAVACAGIIVRVSPHLPEPIDMFVRWLAGAVLIYAFVDGVAMLFAFVYALLGLDIPPMHKNPVVARSLRELWAERWNLVIQEWLATHCYRPQARRGRHTLGLASAFGISALLHFWVFFAALGPRLALLGASYFLVQGALVALEKAMGGESFPRPLGHAWTALAALIPSPLFVEPALQAVGL